MVDTVITYNSTFPNISFDWSSDDVFDPANPKIKGIYENVEFDFTLTFSVPDAEGLQYTITSVQVSVPTESDDVSYERINVPVTIENPDGYIIQQSNSTTQFSAPINVSVSYQNDGAIVNISGEYSSMFNEIFRFVMANKNIAELPINNNEDWDSIVTWKPPTSRQKDIFYTFVVEYTEKLTPLTTQTTTINIPQTIYWSWQTSLAALKNFVKIGKY